MSDTGQGSKSSEFKAAVWMAPILACIVALVPIILKEVPENSVWAVILSALGTIAGTISVYVVGRNKLKVEEVKNKVKNGG